VDVQAELAAPAIKIWGFIKVEETLRAFYLYKILEMMTLIDGTISGGLTLVLSISALILGFGASYLIWQQALKNKSHKIVSEAESEAEVIKKEKILQAKRGFYSSRQNMRRLLMKKTIKQAFQKAG
jgi:hypothetical protein